MTSTTDLVTLKAKLKTWEKQFKSIEGREPSKADIKLNPEIAKMYSAYNTARAGGRKPPPPKPLVSSTRPTSSSTPGPSSSLAQSTPQKHNTSMTTKKEVKVYMHANSPTKLRELLQSNSPRKQSVRKQISSTTPRLKNPFESTSGGGKGSPALFADLLLQAKDTPRTKARRFLVGAGSPVKRVKGQGLDRANSGGLAMFLKSQSQSQIQPQVNEDEVEEDEEDVLGPSPFKPRPDGMIQFKCLFEDQEPMAPPSPTKDYPIPKWKLKSGTLPPFVSNSQPNQARAEASPACAQVEQQRPQAQAGKSGVPKRKRMKPGDEDESFYENINDPVEAATTTGRQARTTVKRTRVNRNSSISARGKGRSKGSQRIESVGEEDESGDEELRNMPDLPFGAHNQMGVITELETFTFTAQELSPAVPTPPVASTSTSKPRQGWKGKGKSTLPASPPLSVQPQRKAVKLGTQKVLVRPYKPVNEEQMERLRTENTFCGPATDPEPAPESLAPLNDEAVTSDAEDQSGDDNEDEEDKLLLEGDIMVSEELMNVLSIKTTANDDRKREKAREERVRRVLEGNSLPPAPAKVNGVVVKPGAEVKKSNKPSAPLQSKHIPPKSVEVPLEFMSDGSSGEEASEDEDEDWEEDPEGWKEVDGDGGLYTDEL